MTEVTSSGATPSSLPPEAVRPGRDRRHFMVACGALAVIAAQSGMPSPLFPLYAEHWSFSPFQVSCVFAAYIAGLAVTLLTTGSLSDHIGRRTVGVLALASAVLAMIVLVLANGFAAVVAARVIQGVAAGLGFGTLGAALLDYAPPRHHSLVAMINSGLPPVSLGLGALTTGVLVQWFPHPFRVPYLVGGAALALALLAALTLVDKHPRRAGALRSMKPTLALPSDSRQRFFMATAALCAGWSLLGLYLGIGPTITRTLLHLEAPTMGGLAILAVTGIGGLTSALTFRLDAGRVMMCGAAALVLASCGIVVAVESADAVVFFVASVVGGTGFGALFQSGLRTVMEGLAHHQRGGTMSALYLISYAAFGLPTLIAGALIPPLGLKNVVIAYAALVVVLAVTAGAVALRSTASAPTAHAD